MLHLFTGFGNLNMNKMSLGFLVNSNKGGKVFVVEEQIKCKDFLYIVCEYSNMDKHMNAV